MNDLYWDNAATTAPLDEVSDSLSSRSREWFANPSSLHRDGRRVKQVINNARERVKEWLGVSSGRLIFTGSGSEANNLAIRGIIEPILQDQGSAHAIVSAVEHKAVLNTVRALEAYGLDLDLVSVDDSGRVSPSRIRDHLREDTELVSVMWANNETGILNPLDSIGSILADEDVLFHTDAVQAVGKISIDFAETPVDFLSLSGHKFHGFKGIGALVCNSVDALKPIIYGGGQEEGLRSGTENILGIWSMGRAAELLEEKYDCSLRSCRDAFEHRISDSVDGIKVLGSSVERLPNISTLVVDGVSGGDLVQEADRRGLAISSGSACASGEEQVPSHVMNDMGLSLEDALSVIRISFGYKNRASEVQIGVNRLKNTIEEVRHVEPSA